MLDFLYVKDPKNKYAGTNVGRFHAVPFLQKACKYGTRDLETDALHFRHLEILAQQNSISELLAITPGEQELKEFINSQRSNNAKDLLRNAYLVAKLEEIMSTTKTEGTFDNTIADFDNFLGELYGLNHSLWTLAGAYRQFDKKGLAARMRQDKKVYTIPELDKLMEKESGCSCRPQYHLLRFAVAHDSRVSENDKRYGLFRCIYPTKSRRARLRLGHVIAPREEYVDNLWSKAGKKIPLVVVKNEKTIPYLMRRHFVEHVKLREDIDDYFLSTRQ